MKSGQVWLERASHHLKLAKRVALDADDAVAYVAAVTAIRTLDELARELKAAEYLTRRRKRTVKKTEVELPPSIRALEQAAKLLQADDEIAA